MLKSLTRRELSISSCSKRENNKPRGEDGRLSFGDLIIMTSPHFIIIKLYGNESITLGTGDVL